MFYTKFIYYKGYSSNAAQATGYNQQYSSSQVHDPMSGTHAATNSGVNQGYNHNMVNNNGYHHG